MWECYLSSDGMEHQTFTRRVDKVLTQIRRDGLGDKVKSNRTDADGDFLLLVADETAEQTAARVAAAQGLRLFRLLN